MPVEKTDAKRSPRGTAAGFAQKWLRWLNYIVLAASIASIVCMLALRVFPTAWGWGFLSFSFITAFSAVVGCISASQSACYSLHMVLLVISSSGQGAIFLLFLTRPSTVLDRLQSNRSTYDGNVLLKLDAVLLLGLFCIQLVVLILACMVHYCEATYYYEDLEGKTIHKGRNLARVRGEASNRAGKEESELARIGRMVKENESQRRIKEDVFENIDI